MKTNTIIDKGNIIKLINGTKNRFNIIPSMFIWLKWYSDIGMLTIKDNNDTFKSDIK